MKIDWNYPPPRKGVKGLLDKFIGPGVTRSELLLQLVPPLLAAIAAPALTSMRHISWTPLQSIVAALLAFDLTGGIITNATSAAKRWYHRQGQSFSRHLAFTMSHVLHIFVVAWLFRSLDWVFFWTASLYLLSAAIIILRTPLYLQRPVGLLLYSLALLLNYYVLSPTVGLEWFLPFFFLKLLVSHLIREEPYRPDEAFDR